MDLTERVWRSNFRDAARSIPPDWLVHVDGFVGIKPERRAEPRVKLYHQLCTVGYAKGWLR